MIEGATDANLYKTQNATIITRNQLSTSEMSAEAAEINILLAEDNQINQKLIALLFKRLEYSVTIVSDGREAVEEARMNSYDLIFMDVHMPEMDGMEATRTLREEMGDNCPPIIALTASAMSQDRERIMAAGMDDFISKPIDLSKLNEAIHRYVLA